MPKQVCTMVPRPLLPRLPAAREAGGASAAEGGMMDWDFTKGSTRDFLRGAIHEALYNFECNQTPICTALQLDVICAAAEETLMKFSAQASQKRYNHAKANS